MFMSCGYWQFPPSTKSPPLVSHFSGEYEDYWRTKIRGSNVILRWKIRREKKFRIFFFIVKLKFFLWCGDILVLAGTQLWPQRNTTSIQQ